MVKKYTKSILWNRYTALGGLFVCGILLGYLVSPGLGGTIDGIAPFREKATSYNFINPLLFYDTPNSIDSPIFLPLSTKLRTITTSFEKQEKDSQISVYYRDLDKGQWIGINEGKTYTPSSLLKVIVMIAYFKEMESQPALAAKKIVFSKDIQATMQSVPYDLGTTLVLGQQYSVDDLINKMIIDSDNGAVFSLLSQVDRDSLNQIYSSLGIKNPENSGRTYTITPETYISFFRILYNATYLNRTMSEKALALLSRSNFQDGITSGLPRTIKVAHKFGETVSSKADGSINFIELHDCGIVYHPRNPYVLCIMSRGTNLDNLSTVIKSISTTTYQYANSH